MDLLEPFGKTDEALRLVVLIKWTRNTFNPTKEENALRESCKTVCCAHFFFTQHLRSLRSFFISLNWLITYEKRFCKEFINNVMRHVSVWPCLALVMLSVLVLFFLCLFLKYFSKKNALLTVNGDKMHKFY